MQSADNAAQPLVTLIMVTMNRRDETLRTLGILTQLPERAPVIVVDNGSDDGTADAVRTQYPTVTVYEAGRNLGSAGRTVGARLAITPYIAFADDDSWWEPGSLAKGVDILEQNPDIGMVLAQIHINEINKREPICDLMERSLEAIPGVPGIPVTGFLACAAMVRRNAYLAVGGFREPYGIGGEEGIFTIDMWELGFYVQYIDELLVHHWPSKKATTRSGRRRRGYRNDLWTTWLRRPWSVIVRDTSDVLKVALRDSDARGGVADALRGLPWVLQDRHVTTAKIEAMLEQSRDARLLFDKGLL